MKNIVCLFICLFMLHVSNAQVNVKFNPSGEKLTEIARYKKSTSAILPSKILPKFNLDSVLQEDAKRMDTGIPFRYGYKFDVLYTPLNSGEWQVENGMAIWRLRVKSANAYSLSFHFSKFHLPETASLIIYNENESFLYGPLTNRQNSEKNKFTTGPVQGEDITIELMVPLKLKDKVQLEISRIIHGYVNILPINSTSSATLTCHNNVACSEGWEDESDAVAKLIMGPGLCSGSLQNSTANDYRAFLLTAFHCVDSDHDGDYDINDYDVDDYVFHFHYKSSTCVGTSASYIEYNGSSYRAGWSDSDFALLEMDESPVGNGKIAFLGWDNRANTPTAGSCIHHPGGDIMKISFDNGALTTNNHLIDWTVGPDSPALTHWVSVLDSGTTEGGSSGGPLFDQNSRVVGQLHGGSYSCPPVTKNFGRFDVSWDGNGTNATQLEHWLDPNNTGNPTTNLLRSPSITVPDVICYSGHTVSIQNPPGVTVTWGGTNVAYPNGNTGTPVTVRAASSSTSDEGTVTASFTVNGILRTITHPVWVGAPDPDDSDIIALDNYGSPIGMSGGPFYVCSNNYYTFYLSPVYNLPETHHRYGITDTDFFFDFDYTIITEGFGWAYIRVNYIDGDSYGLVYTDSECGGYGEFKVASVNEDYCGYYLAFTPNPSSSETILSIESTSGDQAVDETAEWEMEVYDPLQNLKEKKTKLMGNSTKVQTAGWKEGIYVVRVKYNDEILTGKLVVKQ